MRPETRLIVWDIRLVTVRPRFISGLSEYKTFFKEQVSVSTEVFFLALGVLLVTASLWLWERYQAYRAWIQGRDKAEEQR